MKKILYFVLTSAMFSSFYTCETNCKLENIVDIGFGLAGAGLACGCGYGCYKSFKKAFGNEAILNFNCEQISRLEVALQKVLNSAVNCELQDVLEEVNTLVAMQNVITKSFFYDHRFNLNNITEFIFSNHKVKFKSIISLIIEIQLVLTKLEKKIKRGGSDSIVKVRDNVQLLLNAWINQKEVMSGIWSILSLKKSPHCGWSFLTIASGVISVAGILLLVNAAVTKCNLRVSIYSA